MTNEQEILKIIQRILRMDVTEFEQNLLVDKSQIEAWDSLAAFDLFINMQSYAETDLQVSSFMKLNNLAEVLDVVGIKLP